MCSHFTSIAVCFFSLCVVCFPFPLLLSLSIWKCILLLFLLSHFLYKALASLSLKNCYPCLSFSPPLCHHISPVLFFFLCWRNLKFKVTHKFMCGFDCDNVWYRRLNKIFKKLIATFVFTVIHLRTVHSHSYDFIILSSHWNVWFTSIKCNVILFMMEPTLTRTHLRNLKGEGWIDRGTDRMMRGWNRILSSSFREGMQV